MRDFTYTEACEFLAEMNVHPSECEDGDHFRYSEILIDRDKFDEELNLFIADRNIPLDKSQFTYGTDVLDDAPIEALVVQFPYSEEK